MNIKEKINVISFICCSGLGDISTQMACDTRMDQGWPHSLVTGRSDFVYPYPTVEENLPWNAEPGVEGETGLLGPDFSFENYATSELKKSLEVDDSDADVSGGPVFHPSVGSDTLDPPTPSVTSQADAGLGETVTVSDSLGVLPPATPELKKRRREYRQDVSI